MNQVAFLYIDDRERAITAHTEVLDSTPHKISRMTTGDYAVCVDDAIIAIFERKSLEDLAASIKDGRYDNKRSLSELRDRTSCRVYYIVEGKQPKTPDTRVGGIPWGCLESSLDHMTIRDGFNMLYTRDPLDTARRLVRFTRSIQTLINKAEIEPVVGSTIGLLTEKRDIRDDDVVRSMWCKFRGVAATTADTFMQKWTLSDVIRGRVPLDDIRSCKMPDGRNVSRAVVKSLTDISPHTHERILECIPGISRNTASCLLKGCTLPQLLSYPTGAIAMRQVGKPAKSFGDIRAERLKKYFEFRLTPPVQQAPIPAIQPPVDMSIDDIVGVFDLGLTRDKISENDGAGAVALVVAPADQPPVQDSLANGE